MSTIARETQPETAPAPALPHSRVVEALPPSGRCASTWFRAPRVLAGYMLALGFFFLAFCWLQPLTPTDLWGHLAYGRILFERGVFPLPATEPLMPLAEGVPFVDTAWLAQLGGYLAWRGAGLAALRFLYAFCVTVCLGLLVWRMYSRTRNVWLPLGGGALFLWVDWMQLQVVRPQLAGLVCFVALWFVLTARRWSAANWIIVPVIFALWANLHGSFPVGLAVLACFLVGRALDVERHSRQIEWIVLDRQVQRYFFLLELAAAAALLNPYGPGLYAEVFSFAGHPNLEGLSDWEPLTLRMHQGVAAAFAAILLIFLYRLTPRRISAIEVLVLVGLGIAALWTSRMLVWWAPLAAYYAVLHGNAVLRGDRRMRPADESSPRSVGWTAATLGLVCGALALSPLYGALASGAQPDLRNSLARGTPITAVRHLQEQPPDGQVFNTYEWGDYLAWAGPPGVRIFVGSHAHLVPREVWEHYIDVIELRSGWTGALDFYGVNTLLLDPERHPRLVSELRQSGAWRVEFERNDSLEQSIIFVRRDPI